MPYSLGNLRGTDWRNLLGNQVPALDNSVVQDQYQAFVAREPSIIQSSVQQQLDMAIASLPSADARRELALILAGAAYLNTRLAIEELPVSQATVSGEVRPLATLAVSYDTATGERLPVTDSAQVAALIAQPGKTVATLDAVDLSPFSRV